MKRSKINSLAQSRMAVVCDKCQGPNRGCQNFNPYAGSIHISSSLNSSLPDCEISYSAIIL